MQNESSIVIVVVGALAWLLSVPAKASVVLIVTIAMALQATQCDDALTQCTLKLEKYDTYQHALEILGIRTRYGPKTKAQATPSQDVEPDATPEKAPDAPTEKAPGAPAAPGGALAAHHAQRNASHARLRRAMSEELNRKGVTSETDAARALS